MSVLSPKTWALALLAALLLVANLVGESAPEAQALPTLAAFAVDDVTRVVLSTPVDRVELARTTPAGTAAEAQRWEIVTPLQYPADAAQVRSLLRSFGPGVPMEAYVDDGNLEDYEVDHQAGKLLEIFTDGAEPVVSVTVGRTAAGGTTFVRISGSDKVYRADVGGRSRFDRPAADWRDKMALDVAVGDIVGLTLTRGAEVLRFHRGASVADDRQGEPVPGPFELADAPFPIDSEQVEALARGLARMRSSVIHTAGFPGGFDPPAAVAELTLADGTTHRVVVGSASPDKAAVVKVDDRDEVFVVSGQVRRAATLPLAALRDRSLFAFDRADVASMSLAEGGITVVLTQRDDGTGWDVTQPANMDTDQRQALFTVNTLAALRAFDVAPDAGFVASGARFTVRFRDGRSAVLELGQAERDADNQALVRVRASEHPGVFRVKAATLAELRKAFGRG